MKPFEPNYRFHTDAEITWILAQDVEYDAYLTKLLGCAHPILAAHDEVVRKMADVVAYMKTPNWDFIVGST